MAYGLAQPFFCFSVFFPLDSWMLDYVLPEFSTVPFFSSFKYIDKHEFSVTLQTPRVIYLLSNIFGHVCYLGLSWINFVLRLGLI